MIGGPGYQIARPPFVVHRAVLLGNARGPPRSPQMPKANGCTRRPKANFNKHARVTRKRTGVEAMHHPTSARRLCKGPAESNHRTVLRIAEGDP